MIYTCPECGTQYNVTEPGKYECTCGYRFSFELEPAQPVKQAEMAVEYVPEFMRQAHPGTSAGIVCPYCKSKLPAGAVKCANCGEWLSKESKPKSLAVYLILSFLFGHLGIAEFYAGRVAYGFLLLCSTITGVILLGFAGFVGAFVIGAVGILQFLNALFIGVPSTQEEQSRHVEREKNRLSGKGKILCSLLTIGGIFLLSKLYYLWYSKNHIDAEESLFITAAACIIIIAVAIVIIYPVSCWIARSIFPRKPART